MSATVCASRVILALSDALDLVGVDVVQHGKRVAVLATQLGRELGWGADGLRTVALAGLVHDFGVSSTEVHRQLVSAFAWEGSDAHCERGWELLRRVGMLRHLAEPVRYHHTPWATMDPHAIGGDTALVANALFLADRVDAMLRSGGGLRARGGARRLVAAIEERGRSSFAPELLAAFTTVAARPATWYALEPHHVEREVETILATYGTSAISLDDLAAIADIFAAVIDSKSRFTEEHSRGVARLARRLGELAGLAEDDCRLLAIAGLLHDIGKLRVPDAVLDKPDRLDRTEVADVAKHPFETYGILSRLSCVPELAPWAAYHHEKLDGSGYPFRLGGEQLPVPARVVAVADVVQALIQDRPYRPPMPPDRVASVLRGMARTRRLDPRLVGLVLAHQDECLRVAATPAA